MRDTIHNLFELTETEEKEIAAMDFHLVNPEAIALPTNAAEILQQLPQAIYSIYRKRMHIVKDNE
ncbi:hypothetical protein [Mucilaginibacter sp.]